MKKYIILIILIFNIILYAACANEANEPQISIASNDVFQITIETDKTVYKQDEAIECRAVLLYVGDEPLTVYHSDPLVSFAIEGDKYFEGGSGHYRIAVGLSTTFYPGDIMELDFVKAGEVDTTGEYADFYIEYYDEKQLILPRDEYELSASVQYAPDAEKPAETITIGVVANIKVK